MLTKEYLDRQTMKVYDEIQETPKDAFRHMEHLAKLYRDTLDESEKERDALATTIVELRNENLALRKQLEEQGKA